CIDVHIILTLQQNQSKNLLPIVEEVSKGLVTLPLHNRLSINDVKRVCTIISKSIQEWREQ
ncbi:TPA: hypothetical protein ACPE67_002821, partial [Staphylococcus aureus]